MKLQVKDLIAAPFTPMLKNGDINMDMIGPYGECLRNQGVMNVFINGTTGEGMSLSVAERKAVTEKWMSDGKMDCVMSQIGCNSIADVKELARHAESCKVNAIATLPPFYYKCKDLDALVEYLRQISMAAPNTPLVYYHFVGKTGVDINCFDLIKHCIEKVPTFAGIKFTGMDLGMVAQCLDVYGDQILIGYGKDEQVMAGYFFGIKCSVGSTYNYAGKVFNKAIAELRAGNMDETNRLQRQMCHFLRRLFAHGFNDAMNKRMMKFVWGLDMGPTRCPISEPEDHIFAKIAASLNEMQFRELAQA